MIRVLMVADARPYRLVEPQWELLARHLPTQQIEAHLVLIGHVQARPSAEVPGFTTTSFIPRRGTFDPLALWELWRCIRGLRPDVLHAWTGCNLNALAVMARQIGARSVVTFDPADDHRFVPAIPRLGPPSTQWIVATSGYTDGAQTADRRKIRLIPPAVDMSQDQPISRAEVCRELGVHNGARLLIAAGNGRPAERMKDLIWASDLLKCVRDDFRLALLVPEPARRELQRFVDQCEINDLLRLAPSSLDLRQVAPHAEVFLTASLSPATELLVVAMAAGSAVVATNLPEHRGLVISGETGLLAQPRDRAGFARITRKMLDETPLRVAMAEAARRKVIEQHSAARLADEYAKIYQRAVEH